MDRAGPDHHQQTGVFSLQDTRQCCPGLAYGGTGPLAERHVLVQALGWRQCVLRQHIQVVEGGR
jgi:hypothetical protein